MPEVIHEVIRTTKLLIHDKKIEFVFQNKSRDIRAFEFNRIKIAMAIKNIVSNAIDYTKEGKITITLLEDNNHAEIHITDTGIGMSQETREHLFTKFYRSEQARKMETDRSGLGLYIVKNIIDDHKGTIHIQSEEGKGTEVTVRVPMNPA